MQWGSRKKIKGKKQKKKKERKGKDEEKGKRKWSDMRSVSDIVNEFFTEKVSNGKKKRNEFELFLSRSILIYIWKEKKRNWKIFWTHSFKIFKSLN